MQERGGVPQEPFRGEPTERHGVYSCLDHLLRIRSTLLEQCSELQPNQRLNSTSLGAH